MIFRLILLAALATVAFSAPTLNTSLLKALKQQGRANIILSFHAVPVSEIRQRVSSKSYPSRVSRLNSLHTSLKGHADDTQAAVLNKLQTLKASKGIDVRQLWITNQIFVGHADSEIISALMAFDEVSSIHLEQTFDIQQPYNVVEQPRNVSIEAGEEWNVISVGAPEVWAQGNRGQGAVVAIIGSGIRATHEALRDNYRLEYGWYDPIENADEPSDELGFTTQTAGIVVGTVKGIGVAPEAEWITCRGCDIFQCREGPLLECGQWVLCPTDPNGQNADCSYAPQVVSNIWGGPAPNRFYEEVLKALHAANIASIFSVGNQGACNMVASPADSAFAIGVGSVERDGQAYFYTSGGPTNDGRIKPDVSAPTGTIVTTSATSDNSYVTAVGSGYSQPHVAGLTALLYSAAPNATIDEIRHALTAGAQYVPPTGLDCGGVSEETFPNNKVGAGRVYAPASIANLGRVH